MRRCKPAACILGPAGANVRLSPEMRISLLI